MLVGVTTRVLMEFPAEWTVSEIEFYLNDSSSCVSNVLSKLDENNDTECGCSCTEMRVIDSAPSKDVLERHAYIDIREEKQT